MYTYMVYLHPRGDSVIHAIQAVEEGQIISYFRWKCVIQWSYERIDTVYKNTTYFWLYLYPRRTAHALFSDPKKITELLSELLTAILFFRFNSGSAPRWRRRFWFGSGSGSTKKWGLNSGFWYGSILVRHPSSHRWSANELVSCSSHVSQ